MNSSSSPMLTLATHLVLTMNSHGRLCNGSCTGTCRTCWFLEHLPLIKQHSYDIYGDEEA